MILVLGTPLAATAAADWPAYWAIMGVGGALREQPLAGGALVVRPPVGTVVRNLGCEEAAGRTWCDVELLDHPGVHGWVGSVNLRKAPDPTAIVSAPVSATN